MPTPLTTSGQVATAETATETPVADLLTATQHLVDFTVPAEDLPTASAGSKTLTNIRSLFAPLLADITALGGKIAALAAMLEALLPSSVAQTLDHITMTPSASSVMETATAPTLTLGQWQTSDTSTPYTDALSPANAFTSSDGSVATIGATTGTITLQGPGTTTIARTAGGKSVSFTLTVTAEVLTSTPSSLSVTDGASPSAALIIKNQSATDITSGCTFLSSNTGVATVNSSGVVTYVAAGSCNITATHTVDGEACTIGITVADPTGAPVIGTDGENVIGAD